LKKSAFSCFRCDWKSRHFLFSVAIIFQYYFFLFPNFSDENGFPLLYLPTGWLKIRRGVKACEVRQKRLQRFNVTSFVHSIFQHYPYFCFLILTFYFLRI